MIYEHPSMPDLVDLNLAYSHTAMLSHEAGRLEAAGVLVDIPQSLERQASACYFLRGF